MALVERLLNIVRAFRKFKKVGDLNYICKNKLHKASFVNDAVYTNSKDVAKRTVSEKVLNDKAYEIALNLRYDRYRRIGDYSV